MAKRAKPRPGKSERGGGLGSLFAQIAEMPRPEKAFGKNDQTGRENAEPDPRRSVT
jgi:hypothetical protein